MALQAGRTGDDFLAAAKSGLRRSFAAGVTTVADTGRSGAVIQALAELGGSGIAYQEVFGPDPAQCAASLAGLERDLTRLARYERPRVRLGISPHAPYSVSRPLYRAAAALARQQGRPLAVHVAESAAESELLATATGRFAESWVRRGIPLPPGGRSPVAWLEEQDVLGPDILCIHAVRVDSSDIARLKRHDCAVAHCPRSNRRHGHGDAPLAALLQSGLRLGVGTDSAASVYPVDLLAEARAAALLANLTPAQALSLVTSGAARALGMEQEIGTLAPGLWADLVVIRIPEGTSPDQVHQAILDSTPDDVLLTMVTGQLVYRSE